MIEELSIGEVFFKCQSNIGNKKTLIKSFKYVANVCLCVVCQGALGEIKCQHRVSTCLILSMVACGNTVCSVIVGL